MEIIVNELKSFVKSLICFAIACSILPLLFCSFVCAHYGNELVNYVLDIKYPTLTISKSKKIRTLIDTPRNAGIFHFLLQVNGDCDFEKIKQHYIENLTEKRDKQGNLRFPKLRQQLVTCWGHYAWVNDSSSFNANNHITMSSRTYRGRPVNGSNIQEFVSDLVTKYIPSELPQWQVIVIPTDGSAAGKEGTSDQTVRGDCFYILVKVHHLLIAEEEELRISDMLMLAETDKKRNSEIGSEAIVDATPSLSYFVRKPIHIENLYLHIRRSMVKRWNEFIYEFDSLETPDGGKKFQITNVTQLWSVLLISVVNVVINYWRWSGTTFGGCGILHRNRNRLTLISNLLLKEAEHRNLSWHVVYDAICFTINPINMFKNTFKFFWELNVNNFLLAPYNLFQEAVALKELLLTGQTRLTTSYCGRASVYVPLLIYAQMEFIKICYEIFKAPCNIFEEIFQHRSKESNILQVKSYSGRKIVSFSKSIDGSQIRQRLSADICELDFTLACLAGALRVYFEKFVDTLSVPMMLNTTCRTISKGYFTQKQAGKMDHIGGVVFMQLPMRPPDSEHIQQIHGIIESIRRKQNFIYVASIGQTKYDFFTAIFPRVLTKVFINYFSINFPVTLTVIHGSSTEFESIWGQKIEDVLLFRPPQSKTCLSLNIHHFGDKYRLAIMADTQLGPDHSKISSAFETYMENVFKL